MNHGYVMIGCVCMDVESITFASNEDSRTPEWLAKATGHKTESYDVKYSFKRKTTLG